MGQQTRKFWRNHNPNAAVLLLFHISVLYYRKWHYLFIPKNFFCTFDYFRWKHHVYMLH